jgi:hypothetical protein
MGEAPNSESHSIFFSMTPLELFLWADGQELVSQHSPYAQVLKL